MAVPTNRNSKIHSSSKISAALRQSRRTELFARNAEKSGDIQVDRRLLSFKDLNINDQPMSDAPDDTPAVETTKPKSRAPPSKAELKKRAVRDFERHLHVLKRSMKATRRAANSSPMDQLVVNPEAALIQRDLPINTFGPRELLTLQLEAHVKERLKYKISIAKTAHELAEVTGLEMRGCLFEKVLDWLEAAEGHLESSIDRLLLDIKMFDKEAAERKADFEQKWAEAQQRLKDIEAEYGPSS